jgi:hypothetical protein
MRVMTGPVQWVLCDTVNVKGESPNQVLSRDDCPKVKPTVIRRDSQKSGQTLS